MFGQHGYFGNFSLCHIKLVNLTFNWEKLHLILHPPNPRIKIIFFCNFWLKMEIGMQNKSGQNTLSTGTLRPYQPSSSLRGPLFHKKVSNYGILNLL